MSGQQHAPAALYPRGRPGTHFTGGWSQYVILTAFPQRQWLRERTLILRCTYVCCLIVSTATFCGCSVAVHVNRYPGFVVHAHTIAGLGYLAFCPSGSLKEFISVSTFAATHKR